MRAQDRDWRATRFDASIIDASPPGTYPTVPQASPIPPHEAPKRTNYDDLVEVLADGRFETALNEDAPVQPPRKRRPEVP
jgi:hypothetical protein